MRRRLPVIGRLSLRVDRRVAILAGGVAVGVVLLAGVAMTRGDLPVSLPDVIRHTLGRGEPGGRTAFIVRQLRLPRTLAAVGVGAALGASGAIFQELVRNPLVAPDVIGINAGASLAAVLLIVVARSVALLPVAALGGALGAAGVVSLLARRGGMTGPRLVLVGIGVEAILQALVTLVIVRFPVERISPAVLWLTGTLYGIGWDDVRSLLVGAVVLVPVSLALMPGLRAVQLGDDLGAALGVRVRLTRTGLLAAGAGLAGLAVSVAGPLAFVALISPHIARLLAGPLTAGVLGLAAGIGALMVLAADLVAQHALAAISLPAGVVTAAVGAPYFLWLLSRSNQRR